MIGFFLVSHVPTVENVWIHLFGFQIGFFGRIYFLFMIRKWITRNVLLTDLSPCQCRTKQVIFIVGNSKVFTLFTSMRCYLGV